MSCKFSFFLSFTDSFKVNDVGVFQSDNGDLYTVKYRSNVCRDLLLTIEWRTQKQIFVAVKLYNTTFKRCFSSKGLVINGRKAVMKLRGAFNVSSLQNYKVLCVITFIPYIKFSARNDIASTSFDSGFQEHDLQRSQIEGCNDFYNQTTFRGENVEHSNVISITNIENNVTVSSEFESPESAMETEQELQSEEKDVELNKPPSKDGINIVKSNMINLKDRFSHINKTETSVTLIKKDILNSYDKNGKVSSGNGALESEGSFKSGKILNNDDSSFKNSVIESKEDALIIKSDTKINEFVSSDDMPIIPDKCEGNKKKDLLLNANILNEDFSNKMLTKKSANVYDNLNIREVKMKKGELINEEKNLAIEAGNSKLSAENSSVPYKEKNLSIKKVPKTNEKFTSDIKSSNLNAEKQNLALIGNINNSQTVLHPSNSKDNIPFQSCCISEKNNRFLGENLTCCNPATFAKDQKSLKINKEKKLLSVRSEFLETDFQKTRDEMKETEINSEMVDCSESISPVPPSLKTEFILQALALKLSVDDSDLEVSMKGKDEDDLDIFLKRPSECSSAKAKNLPLMENEFKGLSMDMLELLKTGDMADADIYNGEKKIKVHRAIISARSSVLKEMFIQQKKGPVKYRATVDIPSNILEEVIIFMYVGLVYIENVKSAQDLYEVAERYRINDLREICSKHISK